VKTIASTSFIFSEINILAQAHRLAVSEIFLKFSFFKNLEKN